MSRRLRRITPASLVASVLIGGLLVGGSLLGGSLLGGALPERPLGGATNLAAAAVSDSPVPPADSPAPPAGTVRPPGMATPVDPYAARPRPPVAIRIPAIGVDNGLVPLAADAAGVLVPPESAATPGWFTGSAVPGEIGPAVVAGHVDSRSGPGVFYRLRELRAGDEIEIERPDGVAVFAVRSVQIVGKTAFPTEAVYGAVPVPELRLITCGGEFTRATGHYVANVIVEADLVSGP